MKGVRFLVDDTGHKMAVQIDIDLYSGLWEDIYDSFLAASRKEEPRETFASVKARLKRQDKLSDNG